MLPSWLVRHTVATTVCLAVCAGSFAQYGGGGGTGGSGSGVTDGIYVPPSGGYSSGKAIGIGVGVAAGAVVGTVLLVRHHHHHSVEKAEIYVTGCVQSVASGISLANEKNNQTYSLTAGTQSVKAGERLTLKGVVVPAEGSANPTFQVHALIKNYGNCGSASASNSSPPIIQAR